MTFTSELELDVIVATAKAKGLVPVITGVEDPQAWKRTGKQRILCWRVSLWRCGFWGRLKHVEDRSSERAG